MKNLHVHCLAFNSFEMVARAIKQFEEQKPDYPIKSRLLVDQHWPLAGDPVEHSRRLHDLAWSHGWTYVRPSKNRGVCSWNWSVQELGLGEGDILFGADPDGNPLQAKYLDAAMAVFNAAPECYTIQLNQPGVYSQSIPRKEREIAGVAILDYLSLTSWSLGAFDCGWLKRVGGFQQGHPVYGYCEQRMEELCKPLGGRWYILRDFYDEHLKSTEPKYTDWKRQCAMFATQLPFDKWLQFHG